MPLQPVAAAPVAAPRPSADNARLIDLQNSIRLDWEQLLQAAPLAQLIGQAFKAHPSADAVSTTLMQAEEFNSVHTGYFRFGLDIMPNPQGQLRLLLTPEAAPSAAPDFGLAVRRLAVSYYPETLHISPISLPGSRAELGQLSSEALYRTLASHVVAAALQESALRSQLTALRKITAIEQSLLASANKQLQAGLINQHTVELQQSAVANSTLALSSLREQFEQAGKLLQLLLGVPDAAQATLDFNSLQLARELPLEIPAALIERRPDMRAAQLSIQPSSEQYQHIHADILKSTEAILLEIYYDNLGLRAAQAAGQESDMSLSAARARHSSNQTSYRELLESELDNQLAILQLTQARALQLGDAVMLYHALAGPWWTEPVSLRISHELRAAAER